MGFWKTLGKGLLKAAPIAAMAIPGIGPVASMAIQGGLGAANAKVSGGGLKSMLLGAGMGAAGAKLGGGLSPSKGFMPAMKNIGKSMIPSLARGFTSPGDADLSSNQGMSPFAMNLDSGNGGGGINRVPPMGGDYAISRRASRGPSNFPNLAGSLGAGRRAAITDLGTRATLSQQRKRPPAMI